MHCLADLARSAFTRTPPTPATIEAKRSEQRTTIADATIARPHLYRAHQLERDLALILHV